MQSRPSLSLFLLLSILASSGHSVQAQHTGVNSRTADSLRRSARLAQADSSGQPFWGRGGQDIPVGSGGAPPSSHSAGRFPDGSLPQGPMQPPSGQVFSQQAPYSWPPGQPPATGPFASQPGWQAPPGGQYMQPPNQVAPVQLSPEQSASIREWFGRYDEVRRRAQMSPNEKQRADLILSRGLSILMPGPDKLAAKEILSGLVSRYQVASQSLQGLQPIAQTAQLHHAYHQYFDTAMRLFADYLRVQDNLMAKDATGQPIMGQLMQRKAALESLERSCKDLDWQTRQAFGVPPYQP